MARERFYPMMKIFLDSERKLICIVKTAKFSSKQNYPELIPTTLTYMFILTGSHCQPRKSQKSKRAATIKAISAVKDVTEKSSGFCRSQLKPIRRAQKQVSKMVFSRSKFLKKVKIKPIRKLALPQKRNKQNKFFSLAVKSAGFFCAL